MANKTKAKLFAVYLLGLPETDLPLGQMGQIVTSVKDASDIHCGRIEHIRHRLESDTYQINIERLAEELLGWFGYPIP